MKKTMSPYYGQNDTDNFLPITYNVGIYKQDDAGLLKHIYKLWIVPPSNLTYNFSKATKKDIRSKQLEKQLLRYDEKIRNKNDGFFVECGKYDGQSTSATLAFELYQNWSGVEANPFNFDKLEAVHRKSYSLNACLFPLNHTYRPKFILADQQGGIQNEMFQSYKRLLINLHKLNITKEIQGFNIYSVLLALGVTDVDFFSLDVEGYEVNILKTIPFDKITIDTFYVEHQALDSRFGQIKEFFESTRMYKYVGKPIRRDVIYKLIK